MDETQRAQMAAAMDALWAKFLPQMEERLAVLEAANHALGSGELSQEQREAARAAAHKLAGALGSFGLARGTELAREAEHIYLNAAEKAAPAERLNLIVAELRRLVATRA
jgi:HPt (histidine-containing phosphotransfer) domain-containing protein